VFLQIDLEPLAKQVVQVVAELSQTKEFCQTLATNLEQPVPKTHAEIAEQIVIAGFVAQAPSLDKKTICNEIWNSGLETLRELLTEGQKFAAVCKAMEGKVVDAIWEKDFTDARVQIGAYGQSLFRIFNSKYRAAMAEIRGGLKAELPKTYNPILCLCLFVKYGILHLDCRCEHSRGRQILRVGTGKVRIRLEASKRPAKKCSCPEFLVF